ncbi:hypothetical protein N0V90_007908 [Kalmusia sp. IMI 367209]|nr:hypothetical protein N0V90_007908 [Kalmusia sp. IMI 367209]
MDAIYRSMPADSDKMEFRLVSILPTSTFDCLRCSIGTFSLHDTTKAYDEFLAIQERSQKSPSNVLKAWNVPESKNIVTFPATSRHRFQWGDYAALSYVWGNPENKTTIIVNEVKTQVTKNLAEALYSLHETGQFAGRFRLWADALCIDQDNNTERAAQVAAMRVFYVKAWSVIGFLGSEGDESDKALDLVATLAAVHQDEGKCHEYKDDLMQHRFDRFVPGSWLALNRLILRPYWQRLWIMQEIALGGAKMQLCCGSKRIDWETFCHGITVIHQFLWVARHEGVNHDRHIMPQDPGDTRSWDATVPLDHILKDLWLLTWLQEEQLPAVKFSRLLEIANFSNCLNPRDKVYGLLGLMDPELANAILPDYEGSPAAAYTTAAQAYMSTFKNLEFLRDANLWGKVGAPTWVPDWSWSGRGRDSRPDDFFRPGTDDDVYWRYPYRADRGLTFELPTYDGSSLASYAILLDTVDGLGCNPESENNPELVQSQGSKSAYGNVKQTALQFAIALYGSRRQMKKHSSALLCLPLTMEEARKQFTELEWSPFVHDMFHYGRWVNWFNSSADLRIGGLALKSYFSGNIENHGADVDDCWTAYCGWVRTALAGTRRLITTSAGRIGWAECCRGAAHGVVEVSPGDVVAIFPGCSTPILLRSTDQKDGFRVVGEAYIQGMMDGEVAAMLNAERYVLKQIRLY